MINIRQKMFESNSSSTHSIVISDSCNCLGSITPNEEGEIRLTGGEFGWEWEAYNDPLTKANYCAVFALGNDSRLDMLQRVISEQTGAKSVVILAQNDNWDGAHNSYIDHQSLYEAEKAFDSDENLRNFIFNPDSFLYTGNDNSHAPPNFYDKPGTKYKFKLVLDGVNEITLLAVDNLDRENLREELYRLYQYHSYYDTSDFNQRYSFPYKAEEFPLDKNKRGEIVVTKSKYIYDSKGNWVRSEIIDSQKLKYAIIPYNGIKLPER